MKSRTKLKKEIKYIAAPQQQLRSGQFYQRRFQFPTMFLNVCGCKNYSSSFPTYSLRSCDLVMITKNERLFKCYILIDFLYFLKPWAPNAILKVQTMYEPVPTKSKYIFALSYITFFCRSYFVTFDIALQRKLFHIQPKNWYFLCTS